MSGYTNTSSITIHVVVVDDKPRNIIITPHTRTHIKHSAIRKCVKS